MMFKPTRTFNDPTLVSWIAWLDFDPQMSCTDGGSQTTRFQTVSLVVSSSIFGGIPIYPTYILLSFILSNLTPICLWQGKSGKQPKMSFLFSGSGMVVFSSERSFRNHELWPRNRSSFKKEVWERAILQFGEIFECTRTMKYKATYCMHPVGSMHAISFSPPSTIKNQPNEGKYTIHGCHGNIKNIYIYTVDDMRRCVSLNLAEWLKNEAITRSSCFTTLGTGTSYTFSRATWGSLYLELGAHLKSI